MMATRLRDMGRVHRFFARLRMRNKRQNREVPSIECGMLRASDKAFLDNLRPAEEPGTHD